MPLFKFQEPHCDALERSLMYHNVALDASDLGTGKTICACETAKRMGKKLIVVGKKIMKPTWARWMAEWGLDGIVGNWELARRRGLPVLRDALYVFDEVHEGAGYKTLNAKLLIKTYEAGLPVLMLSATAIENPLKMWALGYLLGFHHLKDFYKWGFKNGVVRNYGYPGFHFNGSAAVLNRIHEHVFPEWGSRMRRNLIEGFPECQYILELVAIEEDKRLAKWFGMIDVRETQHDLKMEEAAGKEGMPYGTPASDILPALTFARMRAELSKVPALLEHVKEGVQEGFSVVVFVNFLPTLDALYSLMTPDYIPGMIYGDQKIIDREFQIARFQSGDSQVLLSTIDSGGASINLHDEHGGRPRLALVCPTWRATSLRQALGRVHRTGAKSKAIQKLLYAAGSIEEGIAKRVMAKLDQIDTINDADLAEPEFSSPRVTRDQPLPGVMNLSINRTGKDSFEILKDDEPVAEANSWDEAQEIIADLRNGKMTI